MTDAWCIYQCTDKERLFSLTKILYFCKKGYKFQKF